MPVQTHVVRIVYLVLCSSMLILQNGCSNSGGGNSGTPATDSAATPHLDLTTQTSLTTTTGTPAVVADGHSTVPVRLTVVNGAGTPMAGVAVTFATTDGTLSTSPVVRVAQNLSTGDRVASGEAATGGSIAVSTDANGIAQVLLTASTTAGTAVVTADALGFRTHMDIIFVPGPAARVDLNASPNTVNASGTSTLTATVTDANSNPVPGETVTFTLPTNTSNASLNATSGTTDSNGQVTVKYTAGITGGADTVRAQATSPSVFMSTSITVTAPSGGTVSSSSVASISVANGATGPVGANGVNAVAINATVQGASGPLSGITVTFSTTGGSFAASATTATATTNTSGIATIMLIAPTSPGTATVTASVEGFSTTTTVTFGAGPPATVQLSPLPATINIGGTATLTTTVLDAQNNPVAGQTLTFTPLPTHGTLSVTSGVTDSNGRLTVTYTGTSPTAPNTPDAVRVRTVNAITDSVGLTVVSAPVTGITASAGAASVVADGASTVAIRATVTVASGSPAGLPVSFTTTTGSFAAAATTAMATTDANGVATVSLVAATSLGTTTVTASAGGFSATATVTFVAGAPTKVQLSPLPATINIGGTATLTTTVLDAQNNPVAGQTLTFTPLPTRGSLSVTSGVTDTNGRLTVIYTATRAGADTVSARTANAITDSVGLTIVSAPVTGITASAGAASVVADGASTVAIRAAVTMASGSPASLPVTFTTTAGTLLPTATVLTDANGVATVSLVAATSLGTATVTASAGGFSATATVTFVAGVPTTIQLSANPTTVNIGGTAALTATVFDVQNNPVAGQTLTFTPLPTHGTLSVTSGVTDSNGRLTVTYAGTSPTALNTPDTVRVRTANGTVGSAAVTVTSAPVTGIGVVASPPSVAADGRSAVALRATVTVASGSAAGLVVSFTTTAGTLPNPATATTDVNGIATLSLTAPTSLGSATVTAAVASFSATTTVTFVAGVPNTIQLSATPATVNVGGTATLTATVLDAQGNPEAGQTLTFTPLPTHGTLSVTSGVTDSNGRLTVTYTGTSPTALNTPDAVQVRTANGTVGSAAVTVTSALVTGIGVVASPSSVAADGLSAVSLRATVTVASGSAAGLVVSFTTTAGTLPNPATATTDTNGVATLSLTAATSLGTATVTASVADVSNTATVTFVAGVSNTIQLSANPATVNVGGTATLTVLVLDARSNPVGGQTLTFAPLPSNGTLSVTNGVTDSNGRLTVTYTGTSPTAPNTSDSVQVRTVNGKTGTVGIIVTPIAVPSSITLLASSPQLESSGIVNVTLTALVRDAANNVVSGVPVSFTTDSGAIQVTSGTTVATGTATALLTTGGDPTNRTITVRAITGNLSSTNTVQVTGTTLTVSGASTVVLQAITRLSILLRDSGGTGIQRQVITVSSDLGNTLSPTTVTTDTTGQATVDVTARVPGNDTITVSALGATTMAALSISADNFTFTTPAPTTQVPLNTPQPVTVHWEIAGVNQGNQLIDFFATRGTFVVAPPCPAPGQQSVSTISAMTDANGNATVNICADNAGPAIISAATRVSLGPSSQVGLEFVATTVASLDVQATLTTLGVNASGSNTQQSIITAVARDAQGNLVKNKTVSFSLRDVSGGQIAPGSAVTDSFGRASTVYTAGAAPSARNGVVITAAVGAVQDTVALTVAQQPLFVTLGTGNLLSAPTTTQYSQPYSVLVNDATGNPIANAVVALTVLPTRYEKGMYVLAISAAGSCTGWVKSRSIQGSLDPDDSDQACNNEDSNQNGILDALEDRNSNNRLDPGSVATVPTTVTTNANGFAFFDVLYAKEFTWVEVELQARTVVAGSESSSSARFFLSGLASDFTDCTVAPPGQVSPYGVATTCACDERINPTTCPFATSANSIDLLVSSPQLASDASGSVMLIVLLRDAANNVVSGTPVRFAADSGSVQVVSGTTGVNGTATALLTTPGDPTKRTITVTASTGNLRDTNTVQVVGTTLSVSGVTTLRQGFPTPLTILLRDSAGAAIANHDLSGITVSSLHGNAIGSLPTTTDANGQATVVITGNVAGTDDTITVNALGATGTHTLSVSAATFVLTTEPPPPVTDMPLNTPQGIKIHWDEAGVPQVGRSITFFATRGNFAATLSCPSPTPAVCMTDANGDAIASISSNSAGPTVISAVAAGASGPTTQLSIDFIATMPTSLILQATLTSLAIDQQSVITAVLRDAQGNLVKDQTVRFSLEDVSGGQISLASAVTDSFGRASTVYTASAVPSANNGVSITATAVDSLGNPIRSTILLTVAQQALFVTLGTANNVRNLSSTQYALAYSVLVTDANGTPIANATVALNISPTQYQKGFCGAPTTICPNEDGVFDPNLKNGIRDLNPQDEDINGNQRLDPGNVAAVPTTVTTDATGFAFFDVVYAKEFGGDVAGVTVGVVEVELKARTVVVGSEGSSRALFFLPGECVILTTPPFGTGMNCTDNDF